MFLFLNLVLIPRLGLRLMRDADLLIFAHNIVIALHNNPSFPGVQADVALMKAQADVFEAAKDNVKHGPAGAAALKNEERVKLESMLKNLANQCVIEAAGNEAVFLSSAFELRRRAQPHNELSTPENFDVTSLADPGKVKVTFKRVKGAFSYELWVAKSGQDFELHSLLTGGRNNVVSNLDSFSMYRFRLRASGKNGIKSSFGEIVEVPVL